MIKNYFLLITSVFLINCAFVNKSNSQSISTAKEINYIDSDVFDSELGAALHSRQPIIEVKVIGAFILNDIPKRMNIWLLAVYKHHGVIQFEPDPSLPKTKGFIKIIEAGVVIYPLFEELLKRIIYHPAEDYDLTIFYNPNEEKREGTVTKIVFTRKKIEQ